MKRRRYLGLDIRPRMLRAVALERHSQDFAVVASRSVPLPEGLFNSDMREAQVREEKPFSEALEEVLLPLAGSERRLALSLPDHCGLVQVVESEVAVPSRKEGRAIFRWQAQQLLPAELDDFEFDYQLLDTREVGRSRALVVALAGGILTQYEQLLGAMGFCPVLVSFHFLDLYRFYRQQLDTLGDCVLVAVSAEEVALQFFRSGQLEFYRSRTATDGETRALQEIHRLAVHCRQVVPGFERASLFFHQEQPEAGRLSEGLVSLFGREVLPLHPPAAAADVFEEPGREMDAVRGVAAALCWRGA